MLKNNNIAEIDKFPLEVVKIVRNYFLMKKMLAHIHVQARIRTRDIVSRVLTTRPLIPKEVQIDPQRSTGDSKGLRWRDQKMGVNNS